MSTRRPAVAGQFYPANPGELRETVDTCLDQATIEPAPSQVHAIIAPHAGYVFSGPTAAFSFQRVRGKEPKRVILLGCSHRYLIERASIYERGVFATPLTQLHIDEDFTRKLVDRIGTEPIEPHLAEHCLEVELPFLIQAIGEIPIVPILFSSPATEWHVRVGKILADMADEQDLLVASTDLSHYLNEEEANRIDHSTISAILAQDCHRVIVGLEEGSLSMCGGTAVVVAMSYALARGAKKWELLDYRTSGQAFGDHSRVVGYAAISMEREAA